MQIGLYQAKFWFRRVLQGMLPWFANTDPNKLSLALLPLTVVTGTVYLLAVDQPILYLFAIVLIFARMILATLDGLVAEQFKKETTRGKFLNILIPEVCDGILLPCVIFSAQQGLLLSLAALATCWLTSYSGIVGLVVDREIQSVGPVGQTDRLAALMLFSLLEFTAQTYTWSFEIFPLFLWWLIVGGVVTILNRIGRHSAGITN